MVLTKNLWLIRKIDRSLLQINSTVFRRTIHFFQVERILPGQVVGQEGNGCTLSSVRWQLAV